MRGSDEFTRQNSRCRLGGVLFGFSRKKICFWAHSSCRPNLVPCGWRTEALCSCPLSAEVLSQLKATCISSHVGLSIFQTARVCQISLCFESFRLHLLLLARDNSLLLKGSPDWIRPSHTVSNFIINWLGASSIYMISSIHAWLKNQKTGVVGRHL